jgi:hypothetical protein
VARELARDSGTAEDLRELDELGADEPVDPAAVANRTGAVERIIVRVLDRSGQLDVAVFDQLERDLAGDADPGIRELLRRGRLAAEAGDADQLREIVRHLRRRRPPWADRARARWNRARARSAVDGQRLRSASARLTRAPVRSTELP